jgi:twitching motility two-component system response regulator PilG
MVAEAVRQLEKRPLVLAVDDSRTARRIISLILEQHGYRTVVASDGLQALSRLNEMAPHLVLLDIAMPGLDGYQLCRLMKKNPYVRDVPVVMLTSSGSLLDRVRSRLAGAAAHLTKPLEEADLLRAVEKHAHVTKKR